MKMKGLTSVVAGILIMALGASAQPSSTLQDGQTIPLWSGRPPGALGAEEADIPAITVFLPRTMGPMTPAIIVCPGGSYTRLAANHEGRQVANMQRSGNSTLHASASWDSPQADISR